MGSVSNFTDPEDDLDDLDDLEGIEDLDPAAAGERLAREIAARRPGSWPQASAAPTPNPQLGSGFTNPVGQAPVDRLANSLLAFDAEFWAGVDDLEDFLIAPVITRARGHLLYAPAKAGKSLLTLYLAACAATGRAVLHQPAGGGIRVLYADMEMTPTDVRERLSDMGFGPDDDLTGLSYYSLPALAALDTPQGGAELVELARHHRAELVVIDTISRVVHGEENVNDTAQNFARFSGTPLKAAGIAVLRVDHAGKDAEKGARGASAKVDDVDIVWQLLPRDRGRFSLRATHRRVNWVPEQIELEQSAEPLAYKTAAATWPAGTADVASTLDRLNVPTDWGRPRAAKALREAGEKATTTVLAAAIRYRKSGLTQGPDITIGEAL